MTYDSSGKATRPFMRGRNVRFAVVTWVMVIAGLAWLSLGPRPWNELGMGICFAPLFAMIWVVRRRAHVPRP